MCPQLQISAVKYLYIKFTEQDEQDEMLKFAYYVLINWQLLSVIILMSIDTDNLHEYKILLFKCYTL